MDADSSLYGDIAATFRGHTRWLNAFGWFGALIFFLRRSRLQLAVRYADGHAKHAVVGRRHHHFFPLAWNDRAVVLDGVAESRHRARDQARRVETREFDCRVALQRNSMNGDQSLVLSFEPEI